MRFGQNAKLVRNKVAKNTINKTKIDNHTFDEIVYTLKAEISSLKKENDKLKIENLELKDTKIFNEEI